MIGKTIYQIRKQRGLTLSELAERAGISKSYLSNIERNLNQNPSLQIMEKIAIVLKVDLNTLLKLDLSLDTKYYLDKEWFEFISELQKIGINKEQLHEYKILIEFIKWYNNNVKK